MAFNQGFKFGWGVVLALVAAACLCSGVLFFSCARVAAGVNEDASREAERIRGETDRMEAETRRLREENERREGR